MDIVVASRNPVKVEAARRAFSDQFPDAEPRMIAVNVPSGVRDQPVGDRETLLGATNRVENARDLHPAADFRVGLEGGVDWFNGCLMTFAWMVIEAADGNIGRSRSTALALPPQVQRLVEAGLELGEANDLVFSTVNSKQSGGAFGLLTQGRFTRTDIYAQTLSVALVPLVHDLWADKTTSVELIDGAHR